MQQSMRRHSVFCLESLKVLSLDVDTMLPSSLEALKAVPEIFWGEGSQDSVHSIFESVEAGVPGSSEMGLQTGEQKEVTRGEVRTVSWVGSSLHFDLSPEDFRVISSMSRCVVVQQNPVVILPQLWPLLPD